MKYKALILFLLLAPFLIVSVFNHPSLDDYWNANTIIKHGRLNSIGYSFKHFSGRYFSTLLMSMLNTLPKREIWIFKLFPIAICIFFVACLFFLVKYATGLKSNMACLTTALVLTLLHILNMRELYEGLYWMSATVVYQVAIIIYLSIISAILRYVKRPALPKLLIILILAVFLAGTFEFIQPLFLLTLLLLYFMFKYRSQYKGCFVTACCFAVSFICNLFVLSSPGVYSRVSDDFAKFHVSFLHALSRSFEAVGYYYGIWLLTPANILALLAALPFITAFIPKIQPVPPSYKPQQKILLVASISVLVSMLVYLPQFYLESDFPLPRITTIVFIIFCLSVMAASLTISANYLTFLKPLLQLRQYNNIVWAAFFVSVILSNNFLKVNKDLFSGTAYKFNKEQYKRYAVLRNCPSDTCYIDSIKNWPASIEIAADEHAAGNSTLYWDIYFNKKKVIIK